MLVIPGTAGGERRILEYRAASPLERDTYQQRRRFTLDNGRSSEGYCIKRDDETHCLHWWEGEKCCNCDAPGMSEEEKEKQGMNNG
jgi:hypothetical protein